MNSTVFYVMEHAADSDGMRTTERYLETFPFEIQPHVGDHISVRATGEGAGRNVEGEVISRRWDLRAYRGQGDPSFDAVLRVVINGA